MPELEEKIKELPPDLRQEVKDFVQSEHRIILAIQVEVALPVRQASLHRIRRDLYLAVISPDQVVLK
jgi:mRNA-degrading endonuclease RelE of RelBE toxin-antitoxin system